VLNSGSLSKIVIFALPGGRNPVVSMNIGVLRWRITVSGLDMAKIPLYRGFCPRPEEETGGATLVSEAGFGKH
jgi:hypothetical protein